MANSLDVRLLHRRLGQKTRQTSIKALYADRSWITDLDIVNELGGHTGCVNALSWSKSGKQLASGSDDTFLNIWDYNPIDGAKPFTLNTSVATGHHANIFSVKFMPHSNDRTVITCAGDSEVRVFDLEYGGDAGSVPDASFQSSTRSRQFNKFFSNARWLNETTTNARVYRSHADRAKRVVTESSPHLFLTCSEDGEVRQWDLRQPSSFYPAPRNARGWARDSTTALDDAAGDSVPPPLISYKKFGLDLNSISCSGSQPHYIALGGEHLHCFLHDRRMMGRDMYAESGKPASREPPVAGSRDDEIMNQATRCVRRFAPNDKRTMKAHDHGLITACKISDARPNEVIASWSGDHIYSFDVVKSPDARDKEAQGEAKHVAKRLRHQRDRKRKRAENASSSSLAEKPKPSQRPRQLPDGTQEDGQTAVRVQYEDGETSVTFTSPPLRDALLNAAQAQAERVAHALTTLRKTLFEFSASSVDVAQMMHPTDLSPHTATFTNILGQCASLLPQMDEIMRSWTYPVNPSKDDVTFQNTLRRNRQRCWRFVQAAGVVARTVGGVVQITGSLDASEIHFNSIRPANREEGNIADRERFYYDFLKAITLWISGGKDRLYAGFRRHAGTDPRTQRYPLDLGESRAEVLARTLAQYLLQLADPNTPIVDLDANEFLIDDQRIVFKSEDIAIMTFMEAVDHTTLATNGDAHSIAELDLRQTSSPEKQSQTRPKDKGAAARFWVVKVGRSLLMQAAEGVDVDFVRRAFGGLAPVTSSTAEAQLNDMLGAVQRSGSSSASYAGDMDTPPAVHLEDTTDEDNHRNEFQDAYEAATQAYSDDNDDDIDSNNGTEDDSDEEDGNETAHPLFRRRIAFGRSKERASVNSHVSYSTHTKCYRGHLNARTVKDVNYYGLDDEYVVSGSDDGHFFIWDRKSGEVVSILQGDGEVVNVVQGHPYEPMLAVSGIDSTVKIFGVGHRERRNAEKGIDVANPSGTVHSSLRFGRRHRTAELEIDEDDAAAETAGRVDRSDDIDSDDSDHTIAPNGLRSRKAMHRNYEIMNQNDVARREEDTDAFLTEDVLARIAAVLQQRRAMGLPIQGPGGIVFGGEGDEGQVIEDCVVM